MGFAGGFPDTVTGLVRFGLREYDPAAGRWMARDPILYGGGDFNFYAYAGHDLNAAVGVSGGLLGHRAGLA